MDALSASSRTKKIINLLDALINLHITRRSFHSNMQIKSEEELLENIIKIKKELHCLIQDIMQDK